MPPQNNAPDFIPYAAPASDFVPYVGSSAPDTTTTSPNYSAQTAARRHMPAVQRIREMRARAADPSLQRADVARQAQVTEDTVNAAPAILGGIGSVGGLPGTMAGTAAGEMLKARYSNTQSPTPLGVGTELGAMYAGGKALDAIAPLIADTAKLTINKAANQLGVKGSLFTRLGEQAAQKFEAISSVAGKLPINSASPGDAALRALELDSSGDTAPKVVKKFITRVSSPNAPPLTFDEARDFFTKANSLTPDEKTASSPKMKKQVVIFANALRGSLEQVANQVGQLPEYQAATQQYAQSAAMGRARTATAKTVSRYGKGLAYGAGVGTGGVGAYEIYRKLAGQ